jgi:hypothetical protein
MAEVSSMKNGSWLVFWECDVAKNRNGSTSFQCTGRKPMFTLTYTFTGMSFWSDDICEDALSADLKTVETGRIFIELKKN